MSTRETKEEGHGHASFEEKIKGAAHIVHGFGENVRGSVMGAVESLGGSEEAKAKEEDIVTKGRSEMERGMARLKGVADPKTDVQSKTTDRPQQEQQSSTKQGATLSTTSPPPPVATQDPTRTDVPQSLRNQSQTSRQESASADPYGKVNVQSDQGISAAPETRSQTTGPPMGQGADAYYQATGNNI